MLQDDDVRSIEGGGGEGVEGVGGASTEGRARRLILLVEDSEADRDVYGGLLWYNGYDVVHAADGETALARARERAPDLVLLDIRLKGAMSGLEVCRGLRAEGFEMPVIVLSAVPRAEVAAELEGLSILRYLEKPVDPFLVVREVQRRIGFAHPDTNGD